MDFNNTAVPFSPFLSSGIYISTRARPSLTHFTTTTTTTTLQKKVKKRVRFSDELVREEPTAIVYKQLCRTDLDRIKSRERSSRDGLRLC